MSLTRAAVAVGVLRVAVALLHGYDMLGDSGRYYFPDDPLAVFGLDGGGGPGVLLQAFFLLPPWLAIALQATVIAAGWGWAAVIAGSLLRTRWMAWVVFALVLGWSWAPPVQVWDTAVMTEGMSLAAGVAAVASLAAVYLPIRDPIRLRIAWAGLLGWTAVGYLVRPTVLVFVAPLTIAALAICWRRWQGLGRKVTVVLLSVLILGTAAAGLASQAKSERISDWYAENRLAFRGDDNYWALAAEDGMPPCPGLREKLTAASDPRAVLRDADCPGLQNWFRSGGLTPTDELLGAPGAMVRRYLDDVGIQWTPPTKSGGWTVWVGAIDGTYPDGDVRIARAVPVVTLLSGILAIGVGVLIALGRARPRSWEPLALIGATLAAAILYAWVSWAQDGMEYARHALPVTLILAPSLWTFMCAGMTLSLRSGNPTAPHSRSESASPSVPVGSR